MAGNSLVSSSTTIHVINVVSVTTLTGLSILNRKKNIQNVNAIMPNDSITRRKSWKFFLLWFFTCAIGEMIKDKKLFLSSILAYEFRVRSLLFIEVLAGIELGFLSYIELADGPKVPHDSGVYGTRCPLDHLALLVVECLHVNLYSK